MSNSPELSSFQASSMATSSFEKNLATSRRFASSSGGATSTMIFCKKQFMGRVIGSKGTVVNGIQSRSGTVIHINQDVLPGADCEITISGSQEGVESAKLMIQQIVENCSRAANSSIHKSSFASSAAQRHSIPSQQTRTTGNDLPSGHHQSSLLPNLHLPPQQLSASNSTTSSSSGNSNHVVKTSGHHAFSGDQQRWSSV